MLQSEFARYGILDERINPNPRTHSDVLIKCPMCGKEISDHAGRCPFCGTSIAPVEARPWNCGIITLGVTVCCLCDIRLSEKYYKVDLHRRMSNSSPDAFGFYEVRYQKTRVNIPLCSKCYRKLLIPIIGGKTFRQLQKYPPLKTLYDQGYEDGEAPLE